MSDDLNDPAETPVETAQDAVEPNEPSSTETPAPWGDDFDPDRAWRTITHLRDREKDLEKQAKEFERLQNDPNAFRALAEQYGYEIPEDEPEDDEPEQPEFRDKRVDQLLAERETERRNQQVLEQAAKDVQSIQSEIGRELSPKELEKLGRLAIPDETGTPRVALAWAELKELQGDWQKQWIAGKKSPASPPSGSQGSEKFDINDEEQRIERLRSLIEANSSA